MKTDPYQVLGVSHDATAEQIRQAYHDLARVWHPDRFASDPRLQQVAQERLREIIGAYRVLKAGSAPEEPDSGLRAESNARPSTRTGEQPYRPAARPASSTIRRTNFLRVWQSFPRGLLSHAAIAIALLIVLGALLQILPLLRSPVFDVDLVAGRARIARPQILDPARILDPAADVKVAADTLTEWARGEVLDLWKPALWNATGTRGTVVRNIPQVPDRSRATTQRPSRTPTSPPVVIANGTELIATGRVSGVGELRFINNTDLEEVAILTLRRMAVRAIYVKARNEAMLRSIETGVYDVDLQLGKNLDLRQLRFQGGGFTPEPVGPFQFFSVTTANGTSGQHYEIVVNPLNGQETTATPARH